MGARAASSAGLGQRAPTAGHISRERAPVGGDVRPVPGGDGRRTRGGKSASVAALDPLAAWILQRTGLDCSVYRPAPLNRRIPACLRALRAGSTAEARVLLARFPELLPRTLDTLLIGVTGFARDAAVFDALARIALPSLRARPDDLRVWSAGCADGSELYSAAILLAEAGLLERSPPCWGQTVVRARLSRRERHATGLTTCASFPDRCVTGISRRTMQGSVRSSRYDRLPPGRSPTSRVVPRPARGISSCAETSPIPPPSPRMQAGDSGDG